jgi:hypothetical protein
MESKVAINDSYLKTVLTTAGTVVCSPTKLNSMVGKLLQ